MNPEALKIYKQKLIEIMHFFDSFCLINNLSYYACSGTAIGAVRHKGFIPWDDDIDIFMPRNDFDILMSIRKQLEYNGYAIKNLGDKDYVYAYAKLYDMNTTLIEYSSFPNCLMGVYIDIFPLDEVSGTYNEILEKKNQYTKKYKYFQDTFLSISIRTILSRLFRFDFNRSKELICMYFTSERKKQLIRDSFKSYESAWIHDKGDFLMTHSCIYSLEKELFPKDWFGQSKYVEFENIKIRICAEYDKYLRQLYGDYMTLPPIKNRITTHSHYYLNLKEGLSIEEAHDNIARGETLVY